MLNSTDRAPMNMLTDWEAVWTTVAIIIMDAPKKTDRRLPRPSARYGAKGRAQTAPMVYDKWYISPKPLTETVNIVSTWMQFKRPSFPPVLRTAQVRTSPPYLEVNQKVTGSQMQIAIVGGIADHSSYCHRTRWSSMWWAWWRCQHQPIRSDSHSQQKNPTIESDYSK